MVDRIVICASPRAMGKSARAAKDLRDVLARVYPADNAEVLRLADLDIHHCNGCNACEAEGECFMDDGMTTVLDAFERAEVLYIVSPIYFAGPPGNYKAMLDRLQPYYWEWEPGQPKRPAVLIALGDGGDPNGYEPIITCTRSALAVAGFKLVQSYTYIDASSADIAKELEDIVLPDEV